MTAPSARSSSAPSSAARLAALVLGVLLVALPLGAALALTAAAPAYACSCAPLDTAQQADNADAVLAGTIDATAKDSGRNAAEVPQTVTLTVAADRWWKGTPRAAVEVVTAASGAACGLGALPAGERYVVFARESNGTLYANLCDGTGPATTERLAAVEQAVGAGSAVDPDTDDGNGTDTDGSGGGSADPGTSDPGLRPVADASPPDPVVLAAPGAALVALGLLGLLVVLALGRPRRRRG